VDYLANPSAKNPGPAGTLLLHTKDITHPSWQIYPLTRPGPNYFRGITADFEKLDTYNQDALNHPPVITLSTAAASPAINQSAYLLVPIKNADGTLTLPAPVEYAPYAKIGPVHSGGGNFVVSKGDMIYMVYGNLAPPSAISGAPLNINDAGYVASKLPIPANNPANTLTWGTGSNTLRSIDGVPVFVRSYNRVTKALSEPNFVGYAGFHMDSHNWPAMALDARGNLHVTLNGHNHPMGYTRTVTAGNITQWTPEVFVHLTEPNGADVIAVGSYCSISVDKNDQLVVMDRSDTNVYNHRLSVFTKPAVPPQQANPLGSEKWNAEHSIVVPFNDNYHVWNHRTTYDPIRHRYYLGYYDQGGQTVLLHDAYLFNRFIWPDAEKSMTGGKPGSGQNEGLPPPSGGGTRIFSTQHADFTLLVSDDSGANWRIATTPDFVPQ
jgi:BNR repeat-containing family member